MEDSGWRTQQGPQESELQDPGQQLGLAEEIETVSVPEPICKMKNLLERARTLKGHQSS